MENLPVELRDSILDYCCVGDILNLACCSKDLHVLVKPILWRSVRIPLSALSTKLGPSVENLRHTTHLSIAEGSFSNGQEAEDESDGPAKESTARRKAVDIGFNLARLISYFSPGKVEVLCYESKNTCLEYILERLHHIRVLKVVTNGNADGKMINQLADLEELRVASEPGCLPIADTFWFSIAGEKLKKLDIQFQKQFPDSALEHIGKWTCLEHFCIYDSFMQEPTLLDLHPISALTNLTCLELGCLAIRNDDLRQLCQCLKRVKSLSLRGFQFTNDGLSEIHCLESLSHLDLVRCKGISPRCFVHLVALSLCSVSFSTDICPVSGSTTVVKSDVTVLNRLPSLQKVCVYIHRSKTGRNSSAVIANSLCLNETWKLNFSEFSADTMVNTFTR